MCGCPEGGVAVVFDQGFNGGYFAPGANLDTIGIGVAGTGAIVIINDLERKGTLTKEQAAAARHAVGLGAGIVAVLNKFGQDAINNSMEMARSIDRAVTYGREINANGGGGGQ